MDAVSALARAVLYEGYLLWPYRRSALKNRRRWTIGTLAPATEAVPGEAHTQLLVDNAGGRAGVVVRVRFLHVLRRQVLLDGHAVDELRVGDQLHQSWEEATEREVVLGPFALADLGAVRRVPFTVDAGGCDEAVPGEPRGVLRRSWGRLDGVVELAAEQRAAGLHRLTVRLRNTTRVGAGTSAGALVSAHTAVTVRDGQFVSAMDPPGRWRSEAERCTHAGLWPVLVGEPGERHTVLAAPIVLYDWPRVSPESPGDLFDATEIDRLLVLSVLSMTEAEQREMAAADPRAREILDRCAALTEDQVWALHGTLRDVAKETW
ncbi:hypothetical protein [Goodfellowiella coeruleoviolacea]|uniref:Hydrogenase maturation protease n=1 Tax=Goodfellowiella coeruleoviolacea TaxID=334858 RepID=A0AAE3G8A3_9PSEU|nr:hypothetical protein [Goodfellowiella coeruleoviolacea]MCP2163502.1 hypothetical protein [Goodfellowiella coeruleoviolacea]